MVRTAATPTDPLLQQRANAELAPISQVTQRYAVIPTLAIEPVGIPALTAPTDPAAARTAREIR